jgi:15-cis-phytoene synthase
LLDDAHHGLALRYAPAANRRAVEALWLLDAALGHVLRLTTEPLIAQIRYTWWRDQLVALGPASHAASVHASLPAEPILLGLATHILPRGLSGHDLAQLVDGWDVLLDSPPLTAAILDVHARARGEGLFALSSKILGPSINAELGRGWALIDLAAHWSRAADRQLAWQAGQQLFKDARIDGPKPLRILATLAKHQPFDRLGQPPRRRDVLRAIL